MPTTVRRSALTTDSTEAITLMSPGVAHQPQRGEAFLAAGRQPAGLRC